MIWDLYEKERKKKMRDKFFIEGHRSKQSFEDENTLLIESKEAYSTLEEASTRAKEYFDQEPDLGLVVVYTIDAEGTKEGVKFIFKNDEGELEETELFW